MWVEGLRVQASWQSLRLSTWGCEVRKLRTIYPDIENQKLAIVYEFFLFESFASRTAVSLQTC